MTPDFIKVVRMLRSVRGLDFKPAKEEAINMFIARGWELPRAYLSATHSPHKPPAKWKTNLGKEIVSL